MMDETPQLLLRSTQEYLQALLKDQAPDSLLEESWQEFYRIYSDLVRRFVGAHKVPEADLDDCIQEVWSAVAVKLADFRHPQSRPGLRAWLYAVVRSKAMDVMRRRARHAATSLGTAIKQGQEPQDNEPDTASRYEQQWNDAMVRTLLADLRGQVSEINYRVLQLRFVEGCRVAEIATRLDLKPEQVRYRQHRMLRKLRARLNVYTGNQFGERA